jgi:ABC-type glycerol-3-phosphate transport system substrate-binding protein
MGRCLALITALIVTTPLLAGCRQPPSQRAAKPLGTTLFLAIGVNRSTPITTELQSAFRQTTAQLRKSFSDINSGVNLHLLIFREDQLVQEIQRRSQSGLAPDLVIAEASTAEQLERLGLIRSISGDDADRVAQKLQPELIPQVQSADGRSLFAIPLGIQPQLACYDKRRLSSPPETLEALLQASSQGKRFGLKLDFTELAWTFRGLNGPVVGPGGPEELKQALSQWLFWLQAAERQRWVSFVSANGNLLAGLRDQDYDWITCRSEDITLLKRHLGQHLGLAPMPSGPKGEASPVSRLRVWAFGTNSSPRQQQAAMELVRFSLNPPIQRAYTIQTEGLLPVSRNTKLPAASSSNLDALLRSQQQASTAETLEALLPRIREVTTPINAVLTQHHYGHLSVGDATEQLMHLLQPSPPQR